MTDSRKPLENNNLSAKKKDNGDLKSAAQTIVRARSHFLVLPATYMPRPPTPIEKDTAKRKSSVFQAASREMMFKSKPSSRNPGYKPEENKEIILEIKKP